MIIDRYITREILKPLVTICTVLILIFGCYIATRYLEDAVQGQLPGTTVILLILLRITIALEVLLPTTLFLSVVVALGRLYRDSEMTALFACGISMARVVKPVFLGIGHYRPDCGMFFAGHSTLGMEPVLRIESPGQGEF